MFFKKYFLLSILINKDISNRAFLYCEQKHNQRNSSISYYNIIGGFQ